MTDTTLTQAQAIDLLTRLATNDDFRARFAVKPAKALLDIGLTAEEIIDLDPCCLKPVALLGKPFYQTAVNTLDQVALTATMTMVIPQLRLPGGN